MKADTKGRSLDVMLRIGKSGLSSGTLAEITAQLKKKKKMKIKILKSALSGHSRKEIIQTVLSKTPSTLISCVGNVFVLTLIKPQEKK